MYESIHALICALSTLSFIIVKICIVYFQVIFVVGILTGISLCIAGIVLRRTNRNGDLGVLVYIGNNFYE